MSVVFFGTAEFAVPALKAIGDRTCLVVTQPDRPSGRGMKLRSSPVKLSAAELGIPVETPRRCRDPEFVERLLRERADAFVVAAYGQILSREVLEVPSIGCFNLHGSLLPRHRGAAPIQRAILAGDEKTGITLMEMDEGLDTGAMIAKAETRIGPDETSGELHDRLAALAGDLLAKWIDRLLSGDYPAEPQDDALATYAAKVEKSEAHLSTDWDAARAYDAFRAFTPYPGAYIETSGGPLKIIRARTQFRSGTPGEIIATSPELVLGFADGALELLEVQPAGRRPMSGVDYANGARLVPGDRLES